MIFDVCYFFCPCFMQMVETEEDTTLFMNLAIEQVLDLTYSSYSYFGILMFGTKFVGFFSFPIFIKFKTFSLQL